MLDAVLSLRYLTDHKAIFVGQSEEKREVMTMVGPQEETQSFPWFEISYEAWESYSKPTTISISATEISGVAEDH